VLHHSDGLQLHRGHQQPHARWRSHNDDHHGELLRSNRRLLAHWIHGDHHKATSSDSRPTPTSGSNPGKVEITYYKDDGKKSGEWDVWNISQFPLPEGIYIGCPEVSSVAPDAVITDGAYNGMKDRMSFTIFGTKCTYKDTYKDTSGALLL
jgi:hypothetical protein